jgi:diadenylate cyclase
MVVVFQQDIRRILALVGGQRFFKRQYTLEKVPVTEILTKSVMNMSRLRIGALIAIERGISLRGYEESGIMLNALLSHELLVSIFTPPLPLHDGGIVIRDGRISAGHCLFPVSNQSELISSGMRHRAAVGLSEETDAVIFVVSEETGARLTIM